MLIERQLSLLVDHLLTGLRLQVPSIQDAALLARSLTTGAYGRNLSTPISWNSILEIMSDFYIRFAQPKGASPATAPPARIALAQGGPSYTGEVHCGAARL